MTTRRVSAAIFALVLTAHSAVGASLAPARGTVSGIVLHDATGDPLPNVRVTLARVDLPKGLATAFWEFIGNTPQTSLRAELALPGKYLEAMKAEIDEEDRELKAARKNGDDDEPDPSLAAGKAFLKGLQADEVHSILIDRAGRLSVVSTSAPPTVTDGSGRFRFQNVEPGLYRLVFAGNGLVREDYGQRSEGAGTPITVKSGQSVDGLAKRMTPTGSLSGRITDGTGQPIARMTIQLLRFAYNASGHRESSPVATAQTNDRGEYRFYYLTPGRYTVMAEGDSGSRRPFGLGFSICYESMSLECPLRNPGPRIARPGANRVSERYPEVYYPGAADLEGAGVVEVPAGAEASGINLVLGEQRFYRVRGRIVDPRTGVPPQSAGLSLSGPGNESRFGAEYNPTDGAFDFPKVPAGDYVLNAFISGGERPSPRFAMPVSVNADIDGLTPVPMSDNRLSGRVRIEPAASGLLRVEAIGFSLQPLGPDGQPYPLNSVGPIFFNDRKPDGTFRFDNVLPGNYGLHTIDNLLPGIYIKSMKVGDTEVLNGCLTLPFPEPDAVVEVVLSRTTAQIEGTVTGADGQAIPNAQVVLIPDENRMRRDLFRSVTADATGQFSLANIVPGRYHVAAWAWIEPFSWFDPAVIRQAEEKGKAVQITESSTETVRVPALSAPVTPN